MKKRLGFAIGAAFIAVTASSQLITGPAVLTPANATSADQIRATYTLTSAGCGTSSSTVVTGTVIRTTVFVSGCLIGPPPFPSPLQTSFGPLPAKTYTYEIYEVYEGGAPQFISTQPLVVTASVPTLSRSVLLALAAVLAGIAMFAIVKTGQ